MAVTTTVSSSYEYISNTIIAEARFTEEFAAPLKGTITNFTMPANSNTFRVPRFSTVDAAALDEGVDMASSQDLTVTYTDLTTSEAGLKIILTDKMMREVQENMLSVCGKVMGDAIARYIDEQIIALFDAFTTNTLGATGKDVDEEVLAGAVALLQNSKATRPYHCALHPYCWYPFIKSTANTVLTYGSFNPQVTDMRIQNFFLGNLKMFGVNLWQDGNFTLDASGDVKGAMYSPEALSITTALEPRSETERDASLRGIEIVHVLDFGVAELMDSYGCELYFAADTPAPAGD
jgi:hypothetical protein